jgi:type IV pilus assembly protein PilA
MILKIRQRMARDESGFTLVELLVVMLILGLLAAIAIPAFFNQRDKARDASAKEATRTAQTAIETYATDNGGAYTGATAAALRAIEATLNDANLSTVNPTSASSYVVGVTSSTGTEFTITRNGNGQTSFDCSSHGNAGCPADGNWGK